MQTMRIALQKDTVIKKEILKQEVIDLTNDDDDDDYEIDLSETSLNWIKEIL